MGRDGQSKGRGSQKGPGALRGVPGKGLVSLLASAPGTSVRALSGQLVRCTLLGVLLLAVMLSLDHHSRARRRVQHSPSLAVHPSILREGAAGSRGQRGSATEAEADRAALIGTGRADGAEGAELLDAGQTGRGEEAALSGPGRTGAVQGAAMLYTGRADGSEWAPLADAGRTGRGEGAGFEWAVSAGAGSERPGPKAGGNSSGARGQDRRSPGSKLRRMRIRWARVKSRSQGWQSLRDAGSAEGGTHKRWMRRVAKGRTTPPLGPRIGQDLEQRGRSTHRTITTTGIQYQKRTTGARGLHPRRMAATSTFAREVERATGSGTAEREREEDGSGVGARTWRAPAASSWFAQRKHRRALRRRYPTWGDPTQACSSGARVMSARRRRAGRRVWAHRRCPLPPWAPRPGKYFLAFCQLNRWTNKLICMQRALMFAVLLNRTLLLPQGDVCSPHRIRYTEYMIMDVRHLRQCLARGILINQTAHGLSSSSGSGSGSAERAGLARQGSSARQAEVWRDLSGGQEGQARAIHERLAGRGIVTLDEYQRALGLSQVNVDMLLCESNKCPFRRCTSLGRLAFAQAAQPPLQLYRRQLTAQDLETLRKETARASVLSFGDVFYTGIEAYPLPTRSSLGPLLGTTCPLPVKPWQPIFKMAQSLAATRFRGPYAALHLRRRDFSWYLRSVMRKPWRSLQEAADCVAAEMHNEGLTRLFVATDATDPERQQLQALLQERGIASLVYPSGWNQTAMIQALVDKVVCARAQLFLYERFSSFSSHILQLREGLGRSSPGDKPLCKGWAKRSVPHVLQRAVARVVPRVGPSLGKALQ